MDRGDDDVKYVFISPIVSKACGIVAYFIFIVGLVFVYIGQHNPVWYNYLIIALYIPSIFLLFLYFFGRVIVWCGYGY